MDDLLSEFVSETVESLDVVDVELVKFEQDPGNEAILNNIFRLVHTIKGTCGFLDLPRLEKLAHASETLMGRFRDGEPVTRDAVSLILKSIDQIKALVAEIAAHQIEPDGSDQDLIEDLLEFSGQGEAETPDIPEPELKPGQVSLDELERIFQETEGPDVTRKSETAPEIEPVQSTQAPVQAAKTQSIRVNVDTLENLITMVGELVLTRNQLVELERVQAQGIFDGPLQRLTNVTAELQDGIMQTRMQPIGNAWQKLPRIIRDLGQELGKDINLNMSGGDTELDRQVLELVRDPLTHMVRNSADHGLETAAERVAAGKPETGQICLNARHEGGYVIIEISDDGRGLNTEKLRTKIVEAGLVDEAAAQQLTAAQIHRNIFNAGLSTATNVTSVSGRGVGMDVVRSNIEEIGGSVELKSVDGKGTTFTIKIPLTLAIVSALIVETSGERYAIPQLGIVEIVRIKPGAQHKIEMINDAPVLRSRNKLLPLVDLSMLLEIGNDSERASNRRLDAPDMNGFVIVSRVGSQDFGIVVDTVFHTEEIVIKPMSRLLRGNSYFSGNTILGDGSVILIIDANGIAELIAHDEVVEDEQTETTAANENNNEDATPLLLFKTRSGASKAIPLSLVTRLEEIFVKDIEQANGKHLVQYRGNLMPLVFVDQENDQLGNEFLPVLVFTQGGRSMGLVVGDIIDIVEENLDISVASETGGVLGSAIINGHATEIIDLAHYLPQAYADWFQSHGIDPDLITPKVLLVDDNIFFRNLLGPVINANGFAVSVCESAEAALALCAEGRTFDAIVTDIEMPEMDGFELAEAISKTAWRDAPVIALSSHCSKALIERGREVGLHDFVAKFDREGLIEILGQFRRNVGEAA